MWPTGHVLPTRAWVWPFLVCKTEDSELFLRNLKSRDFTYKDPLSNGKVSGQSAPNRLGFSFQDGFTLVHDTHVHDPV